MNQVIAHAPAKINLCLEVAPLAVGETRHQLRSIFCTTTLADTLVFDFTGGSSPLNLALTFEPTTFDLALLDPTNNTLTQTLDAFEQEYGRGFLPGGTLRVQIIKSIPAQAGLGGGSSNAAALLRMLCWLAQVEPTSERSLAVARRVGADVPFFLYAPKAGFAAQMGGRGDKLVRALPKPELHLALVKPQQGVPTAQAYAVFDELLALPQAGCATQADSQRDSQREAQYEAQREAQRQTQAVPELEAQAERGMQVERRAQAESGFGAQIEQGAQGGVGQEAQAGGAATDALAEALLHHAAVDELAPLCVNRLEPAAQRLLPELVSLKRGLEQQPGVIKVLLCGSGSTLAAFCQSAATARACANQAAAQGLWAVAVRT